jgi:hypothetical protein
MSFQYIQPFMGLSGGVQTTQVSGAVGGWKELGRTTLGSAASSIDVSSLANKRYLMVLQDLQYASGNTGNFNPYTKFNSTTGSEYALRYNGNGGSEVSAVNNTNGFNTAVADASDYFGVVYTANLSNKEKLSIAHYAIQNAIGAATAPKRGEVVGKWVNTSDAIHTISSNNLSAGDYDTGSEVVVLGWDEADTHTTNFWEELASVELGSAASEISSGTISAKKYLWIQCWSKRTGANDMRFRFNNDTGSNYANRKSSDGGTDATITSATSNAYMTLSGARPTFLNMFVVNNSANEKLCIYHVINNTTAGAGTAPQRQEWVGKWANTSSQITEIDIQPDGGNLDTGSILKVWGSD